MAYGAELAGAGAPVQFIYVWPSRELIERSWSWPASWHEAFQDAASRIGLAVAIYLLDGSRLGRRLISLQLSKGFTKFRVKRRGGSVFITVVAFTGPDAPGPDAPGPDGARQPSGVDGLVLGLHGSGKNAYLVVFHGTMPIPAGAFLPSGDGGRLPAVRICRPSNLQLPTARPMAPDTQCSDDRRADRIAEAHDPATTSASGILRFSPVLHFRLVSGRPIYVAGTFDTPERSKIARAGDRVGNGEPGQRRASTPNRDILSLDGIEIRMNKETASEYKSTSEHRLKMEKSPFRHLRSRYLH